MRFVLGAESIQPIRESLGPSNGVAERPTFTTVTDGLDFTSNIGCAFLENFVYGEVADRRYSYQVPRAPNQVAPFFITHHLGEVVGPTSNGHTPIIVSGVLLEPDRTDCALLRYVDSKQRPCSALSDDLSSHHDVGYGLFTCVSHSCFFSRRGRCLRFVAAVGGELGHLLAHIHGVKAKLKRDGGGGIGERRHLRQFKRVEASPLTHPIAA